MGNTYMAQLWQQCSTLSLYITLHVVMEIFFPPKKFLKPCPGSCGLAVKKSEELPRIHKVRTPTGSVEDIYFLFPCGAALAVFSG